MNTDALTEHVVLDTGIIIGLGFLLGGLARKVGQPRVVGQIVAGIALGPSVLGHLPGHLSARLFGTQVVTSLTVVSQIALVLFLFSVGYELDLRMLRQRKRTVPIVVALAFGTPMVLGGGSALAFSGLYRQSRTVAAHHVAFVLFIAVAMSITAVPVLASIIAERGIATTVPAVVAMAAAGLIDGIGWLALTAAVLLGGGSSAGDRSLTRTAVLFAVYIAVMVGVVRPALMRWMRRPGALVRDNIPVIIAVAMISAWVTAALGLHVIFGAFLAGVIMPRTADGAPDAELVRPLHQAAGLLLPLFFVVSGLPVNLTGMTAGDLALLAMVCGIAVVGKLGGGGLGAWLGGLPVREAKAVGVMLNTRGLTELIALNIGLRAGLIDGRIYTVLVVMALLTTALTGLLLNRLSVGVEAGVEAGVDGSGIDQAAVRPAVATPSAGAWPASKAGTADPSLSRESLRDGR